MILGRSGWRTLLRNKWVTLAWNTGVLSSEYLIITEKGKPSRIRTDNGPEFISKEFRDWCSKKGIEVQYIQPGRPMQNGYIERFNRTFRENILDAYLFENTMEVQILAEEWMQDYNYNRPHEALQGKTPMEYRSALPAACCY